MIEHIDPFMFNLCFVVTRSIQTFIQRQGLQKLETIKLMALGYVASLQRVSF